MCTAIGVAIGAGAAQLGVGYGLNIVVWVPQTEDTSRSLWLSSLAWVAWLTANSTVMGAVCADRLSRRGSEEPLPNTALWHCAITLSSAVGALVIVPLVAIPARFAQQIDNSASEYTAGGYAMVGILVGLIATMGALTTRAIAANIMASASWLWILGIAGVANGLRHNVKVGTAQLGTWQFNDARWLSGIVNLPSALLMLTVAVVIGVLTVWMAGYRKDNRIGVAISGAVGPLLVAAAYILAVPVINEENRQLSAYVVAPYAVIAGLAGSVLATLLIVKNGQSTSRPQEESTTDEDLARDSSSSVTPTPPSSPTQPLWPKRTRSTKRAKEKES